MKLREAQDVAQQQVNALTGMLSCKMDKVCHRLVGAGAAPSPSRVYPTQLCRITASAATGSSVGTVLP